ncbi:tRNA 2-selenouridine(34) synthase MnmH [Desulfoscipio gibsoniae]|uniref:tRNA 2-selenouridine synthase n=1 Tax=Desulfoscipio gibsoniae DSM 7213 TaxID=767817 RepID=R4KI59_9FIRM|nr:tRNA 2-selenouridine(34) synthase MnmH [Desulfoscipio gibsoniae]AGL01322.1 tRNA 2-selenouridine synthase [Desulfoscipio gibsoniae DSM 7213]
MYTNVDIYQALHELADVPVVDLRSPGEYGEATIPGAFNIPLLDNIERALVGTVHKNQGPDKARELAMEIVAPRLPVFVKSFQKIAQYKKVMIFCWRGGDRSHFAGSILDAMGFKVYRILGGFKAYRRLVTAYLGEENLPLRAVVVHGLTGVGKTDLLLALKDMGHPVLDLEGLAKHRGSVFGKIGQPPSPGQKMFEALIERALRRAEKYGIFLVECESRRLGNLYVPDSVLNTMQKGHRVLLYAPFNTRVQRIMRDYALGGPGNLSALQDAVVRLTKYLGKTKVNELNQRLAMGNFREVFGFLLGEYYDPLYKYPDGPSKDYDLSVNTQNMHDAVQRVSDFIISLPEYKIPGR